MHEQSRACTDIRAILLDELTFLNEKHVPIYFTQCKWTETLMVNLLEAIQVDRNIYGQFV